MDFGFTGGDAVIVTGAASGIGRAVAVEAARQGLRVVAWDMAEEGLAGTAASIEGEGGSVLPVVADISRPDDVRRAAAESTRWGPPRYLVNNAGPPSTAGFDFDEGVAASLGSTRRVTASWLDLRPAADPSVVSVASIAALVGGAGWYPVAKAGIAAYMRSLAVTRPGGVRANAIAPGVTDTPRTQALLASDRGRQLAGRIPLGRVGTPEDMAHAALFLLSPAAAYVNGVLLVVDGGQTLAV